MADATIGRVGVDVFPDLRRFTGELRSQLSRATRGIVADVQARVTANAQDVRRDIQTSVQNASQGVRAQVAIEFIPAVAMLRAQLARLVREASRGVVVNIPVQYDQNALAAMNNALGGGGGGSSGIGSLTKSLLKMVGALGALGSGVQVVAGLAAAIGQLAPAALLLPGALLTAGSAYAALKVGMSGVSDALSGDAEAMARLAPAARQTVQAIQSFKTEWQGVQQATQGALFEGLAESVQSLGSQYLPVLRTGLSGIAGEFNLMGKSAAAAFSETRQVDGVSEMFANVRQAIAASRNTLTDFMVGFLDIGIIGSDYLRPLAEYIARAAAEFRLWASDTQRVRELIDGAIAGFQLLGAIAGNIGSIIGSVFAGLNAGAGQSFLTTIEQTTAAVAEFLRTAEAQEALRALGETLRVAGEAVRAVLLEALKQVTPIIIQLAPMVQQLAAFLRDNAGAVVLFGGALLGVRAALAVIGPLFQIVSGAVKAFQLTMTALNLVMSLNPFGLIVIAIGALVAALVYAYNTSDTFRAVVDEAFRAVAAAGQWVVDQVSAALAWFGTLPSLVGGWMAGARDAFVNGWNGVVAWVRGVPGMILSALGNVGSLLLNAGRSIVDGLWRGLKAAFKPMIDWVSGIAGWIARVKGPIPYDKRLLIPAGKAIMGGLSKGLQNEWSRSVLPFVSGLAGDIAGQFGGEPIDVKMRASLDGIDDQSALSGNYSQSLAATVSAQDFGRDDDRLVEAISGLSFTVDGQSLAKVTNKANTRRNRRG